MLLNEILNLLVLPVIISSHEGQTRLHCAFFLLGGALAFQFLLCYGCVLLSLILVCLGSLANRGVDLLLALTIDVVIGFNNGLHRCKQKHGDY